MQKKKKKPTPRQPISFQHLQVLFLLLSAPSYFQLFMEQAVSHMVELEWFRSLLSKEKQEKKGLAVQANDISASASRPRPWKMQPLLQEGLQSDARRQKQFAFLAVLQNTTRCSLVRFIGNDKSSGRYGCVNCSKGNSWNYWRKIPSKQVMMHL